MKTQEFTLLPVNSDQEFKFTILMLVNLIKKHKSIKYLKISVWPVILIIAS